MAAPTNEEFEDLRRAFADLQREHQALEQAPFDRESHARHRAHLRAYTEALHRWRAVQKFDDDGESPR
jgi:hypothetical protein